LDRFVEQSLLPEYNHGDRRRRNPAYATVDNAIERVKRRGDRKAARLLKQQGREVRGVGVVSRPSVGQVAV